MKPYYNSIKDTSVCGPPDFNCLIFFFKYEVNHDILLLLFLAPGYTVITWIRFADDTLLKQFLTGTGVTQLPDTQVNFHPLELTLVLQNPELNLVLLNPFLRSHLIRINNVFHTN